MKLVLVALAAASILTLGGCQRDGRAARGPIRQLAEGEISAILLTDSSGIGDRSFNAAAWRGILEFYGEDWYYTPSRGRLYETLVAPAMEMYIPNLMLAVDEGYDLIVTAGFTWANSVSTVAGLNPRQNFLIVDVDWVHYPNVMQAMFAEHEGSFLVGAAAALQALEDGVENPRFGFIGGIAGAVITRFHVGFVQGVLSVIPDAEILEFYVNSWVEPAIARTQAISWYNDGVFAIFSAAGASGNGTIAEARDQRMMGRNVWAIGVDSDQFDEGLYTDTSSAVLTSMIKRVESSVIYALNAVRDGTFYGRLATFDLAGGGVGFSTTNPALGPNVVSRLREIEQKIISGEIVVEPTLAAASRLPGFPQLIMARDG
ncbi:MAG: BMP family ABC transporter substrate-binding protein [Treponema sp.]|nr:BMP family ABC transporter substrate-binding protein [Treponema sp.]